MGDENTIVVLIIIIIWEMNCYIHSWIGHYDLRYVKRISCGKIVMGCVVRHGELLSLKSNIESRTELPIEGRSAKDLTRIEYGL